MTVLGVITCEILELEFAHLLANDTDITGVTVLEDHFGLSAWIGSLMILALIIVLNYYGRTIVEESMMLSVSALFLVLAVLVVQLLADHTAKITEVSATTDTTIAGAWIAEGVTIYSFNGESLLPNTDLNVHVLTNLTIDPDGYSRASVRYREPEATCRSTCRRRKRHRSYCRNGAVRRSGVGSRECSVRV